MARVSINTLKSILRYFIFVILSVGRTLGKVLDQLT